MSYRVFDWAGNEMPWGVFDTFEDAWGEVYRRHDHLDEKDFDECMGEYFVDTCSSRESRYLDPMDPRAIPKKKVNQS